MAEIQIDKDANGNPVPIIRGFSPEELAHLENLSQSGAWILYRKVLNQALQGLLFATIAEDNPTKMAKNLGQVAGMNFAINQLGLILEQAKQQAKRVENRSKNSSHAEG